MVTMSEAEAAAPIFQINNAKTSYYQKENLQLSLYMETPHAPMTAAYYIVNESTNKATKLGAFDLESMSAGFGAGLIITQAPGTYHYLAVITEGTTKTKYITPKITILSQRLAPRPEIRNFMSTLHEIPYYEQTTDHEYRLSFLSTSSEQFSDVMSEIKASCSRPVRLYEKTGSVKCSKSAKTIFNAIGNNFDVGFFIDEDDLQKDVTLQLEYKLRNLSGKVLDILKLKRILSKDAAKHDAIIKVNLANMRAAAELHYDEKNNTYSGLCSTKVGLAYDTLQFLKKELGEERYSCAVSNQAYAISAPLSTGKYHCVDSTGFSNTVNSLIKGTTCQ